MADSPRKTDALLSEKKKKRIQNKKRKIEAFLSLSNQDMVSDESGQSKTDVPTEMSSKAPPSGLNMNHFPTNSTTNERLTEAKETMDKTQEELNRLRAELRAKQKAVMQKPKLYLTLDELYSSQGNSDQPALYMMDLQHLLLYALQGNTASYKPRWCRLLRVGKLQSVALLVVNGLSYQDFIKYRHNFSTIDQLFNMKVEMISPYQYGMTLQDELFWVPLSCSQIWKLTETLRQAKELADHQVAPSEGTSDAFSRRMLLMNPDQLILEGYPLPIKKCKNYVYSCDKYKEVTDSSPLFAIDCEMCMTTRKRAELTRISVINEKLEVLFDSYVKPFNTITDYLTKYSGITEHVLRNVSTRLIDVQKVLRSLLPQDAILCGQSLNADLHALEMFHPYVIDTSVIYNMTGNRRFKTGLRVLTARFLRRSIQDNTAGHNSVEDATATMDLVKLKLSKSLEFGDLVISPVSSEFTEMTSLKNNSSVAANAGSPISESAGSVSPPSKKQKCDIDSKDTDIDADRKSEPPVNSTENDRTGDEENMKDDENKNDIVDTGQKKAFFNKGGASMYESFFKILQDSQKKAILVDNKECTMPYNDQYGVTVCVQDCDKTVVKATRECVAQNNFTWAQLHSAESIDQTEEKETIMKKIDKQVKKVLKSLEENTLFMVVFAGRESNQVENAACFMKIT